MRLSLRRLWMWRHTYKGLAFVNAVMGALGRPSIDERQYQNLCNELLVDRELAATYERSIPRLREISPHKQIASWAQRLERARAQTDFFYVLPRLLRPEIVVETGVASGSMTSFLLAALHQNNAGSLLSFDLPAKAGERSMDWTVKNQDEVGFLIPSAYRDRWTLTVGDATYELPLNLEGKKIDCFFHDSDHSYDHMMYEYAFASKHLAPNGWIISDDISMNEAFPRYFGRRMPIFFNSFNPNIGIAVPPRA